MSQKVLLESNSVNHTAIYDTNTCELDIYSHKQLDEEHVCVVSTGQAQDIFDDYLEDIHTFRDQLI